MNLKRLIKAIEYIRKDKGYDCPIAVTGPEQSGKSTMTIQVVRSMFYEGGDIEGFLEKHLAYVNSELEPKMIGLEKHGAIIGDEAIRWAYRRNWMNREQKEMGIFWRQIGFKRLLAFFNLPVFWELDNLYRNGRVKLWIHVFAKGHAAVFQPNVHAFSNDPWNQKEVLKSIVSVSQFDPWEKQLAAYSKCSAFFDHIEFSQLPDKWFGIYSKISEERKVSKENRTPSKVMDQRDSAMYWLHEEGYTEKRIGERICPAMPTRTVHDCINRGDSLVSGG